MWDVVFANNQIRDTRPFDARRQTAGIQIEDKVGSVTLDNNTIDAKTPIRDQRKTKEDRRREALN